MPVSARHFHEWRTRCQSCEEVALAGGTGLTLTGQGDPERLPGLMVSANFFRTLGVPPVLGRDFDRADEGPGRARVVILSDSFWRRRFNGDPSAAGRTIVLDGEPHQIVGVMPPALRLPKGEQWGRFFAHKKEPLVFRPMGFDPSQKPGVGEFNFPVLVRLRPGVVPARATDEMNAAIAEFVREFKFDMKAALTPMERQITGTARPGLLILLGAVAAVLLIVCVNLGNLMLVRAATRQRDAAIRIALGASRSDLFSHVMKEASVLVALGGLLGTLLAYAGMRTFIAAAPVELPRLDEVAMDWRVLAFAFLASSFAAVLCALAPAWRTARTEPDIAMRASSARMTGSGSVLRLRELLVGVEVALSAALLIVAGLLIASFQRVMEVEKGFEVQSVLTQSLSLSGPRYREMAARNRFVEDALAKLGSIPGVISAGATTQLPLRGETWIDGVFVPGKVTSAGGSPQANYRFVSPGYAKAIGIPIRQGRFIDETDRNRPVAVVSEQVAQRIWPGENPLGKRIHRGGTNRPAMEVIGVVADVRAANLEKDAPLTVYEPYWTLAPGGPVFVLRTNVDPAAVAGHLRAAIASLDPDLPLMPAETMERILVESVAPRRFQMTLATAFAAAALLLAALGVYGVVSFSVARRTQEMSIRLALGAQSK